MRQALRDKIQEGFLTEKEPGTSLMVQWLRICLPRQGMQIHPLVGEPKSHMPQGNYARVLQTRECTAMNDPMCRNPLQANK